MNQKTTLVKTAETALCSIPGFTVETILVCRHSSEYCEARAEEAVHKWQFPESNVLGKSDKRYREATLRSTVSGSRVDLSSAS